MRSLESFPGDVFIDSVRWIGCALSELGIHIVGSQVRLGGLRHRAHFEDRGRVDSLCVHHGRDALGRREHPVALPALESREFCANAILQKRRGLIENAQPFLGPAKDDAAAITPGTFANDESAMLQAIQDPGNGRLTKMNSPCEDTDRDLSEQLCVAKRRTTAAP